MRATCAARIIPARAGFTTGTRFWSGPPWDHPRSRGVYKAPITRPWYRMGSSPLARGLLRGRLRQGGHDRIIPARAGFTTPPSPRCTGSRDHPRSRGVYAAALLRRASARGSSPLARGLRTTGVGRAVALRIIPARAGFTARHDGGGTVRHGSSPLARGLLPGAHGAGAPDGIIPARAGFTRRRPRRPPPRGDHPRSRGVYLTSSLTLPQVVGSSPLARGLHLGVAPPAV